MILILKRIQSMCVESSIIKEKRRDEWFYINPYEKVICDEDGNYLDPDCTGNRLRSISKKNRNTIPFPFIETHLYYVSY